MSNKIHMICLNSRYCIWGNLKTKDAISGAPIIRIISFPGLSWGSPVLGNYHIALLETMHRKEKGLGLPTWAQGYPELQLLNPESYLGDFGFGI